MKKLLHLSAACALSMLLTASASADTIIDAVGDFIPTYAGPLTAGDLDVVRAEVFFTGTEFVFTSTSAAPIGTTPDGFFVWGINRGAGTARFPTIAPGVLFDSVVVIRPGTSNALTVTTLIPVPPSATMLPLANVTISGNDLIARIPLALLPSLGFSPDQYTVNLWPRFGGQGITGDPQISDFAPDNSNAPVTAVPEPTTMLLLGTGLAGIAASVRKRRRNRAGN